MYATFNRGNQVKKKTKESRKYKKDRPLKT